MIRLLQNSRRILRAAAALACSTALTARSQVPGTVVDHVPQSTGQYVGSPTLAVLPDGSYVAAHDLFGPSSAYYTNAVTQLFRSTNQGQTWAPLSTVTGALWSNLFVNNGALYMMGTNKEYGDLLIRKSTDGGVTWTNPTSSSNGKLVAKPSTYGFHSAPMTTVIQNGRIYRAFEDTGNGGGWSAHFRSFVMSAPVGANLLNAANWTYTNKLVRDTSWLPGNSFNGFLEGNVVVDRNGQIVNMLRVDNQEKAAIVRLSNDTTASLGPSTDIVNFPGGAKKFAVRYDCVSDLYWAISSPVLPGYEGSPGATRNALAVMSSPDLKSWNIKQIVAFTKYTATEGFQYPDFQFAGNDLAVVSRTAYEDGEGGAHNYHDANYLTFHRVSDFRSIESTRKLLVADTNNGRVMQYDSVGGAGGNWWLNGKSFTSVSTSNAFGMVQDRDGFIYVNEQKDGGRIIKLDASGNYLSTVGTEGAQFTGRPEAMTLGPDGKIYMSVAFGTNSDRIYKIDTGTNAITPFIATTGTGYTLSDPRGLAFGADGNLYVADRNNNKVCRFDQRTGAYLGDLYSGFTAPTGLSYDESTGKLLASGLSVGSRVLVSELDLDGSATTLANTGTTNTILDAQRVDGQLFYSDYSTGKAFRSLGVATIDTSISGLSGPGHVLAVLDTPQWNGNASAIFTAASNWAGQRPPIWEQSILKFGASSQANLSIDIAIARFAGVNFDAGAPAYTFSGNGFSLTHIGGGILNSSTSTQTFNTATISIVAAAIDASAGNIVINSPISVSGLLILQGNNTSQLGGGIIGGNIIKRDSGTSLARFVQANTLRVAGGTINIGARPNPNDPVIPSTLTALTIEPGATLDLNDSTLSIDYIGTTPIAQVAAWISSGFNGGGWNGTGIISGSAKRSSGYAIGYRDDLANTLITLHYTFAGDATLDGKINTADFNAMAGGFGAANSFWVNGDFNYSGGVDSADFNVLISNYGKSMPAQSLGAIVPEPASIAILLLSGLGLTRRAKHRSKKHRHPSAVLARTNIEVHH